MGLGAMIVGLGCDPDSEPFSTTMPPRDPEGSSLRRAVLAAERITVRAYIDTPEVATSTRLLFGRYGGIEAITFIRHDQAWAATNLDSLGIIRLQTPQIIIQCLDGHGEGEVEVAFVAVDSAAGRWNQDLLRFDDRPALDPMLTEINDVRLFSPDDTTDANPRTLTYPIEAAERWFANPEYMTGFALQVTGGEGIFAVSSSENGLLGGLGGPLIEVDGCRTEECPLEEVENIEAAQADVAGDAWVAEDTEPLPCADPDDCFRIGRGIGYRAIMTADIDEVLPAGTNIHRAVIRFKVLPFARFDKDFELQVFRLTEELSPGEFHPDSIETSGILWHTAVASPDSATVEIPITNLAQAWFDGAFVNRGILVRTSSEDADFATVVLGSPAHPDPAMRPDIEITYSTPYGGRP
jgi:hypothetical protein